MKLLNYVFLGTASAMVTCPIQKEALYAAGFAHQGHTDYLAHLARRRGAEAVDVMMLVGGGLRAIPVTVHIALKDVPNALTGEAIERQAKWCTGPCSISSASSPRLAFTGLNPHAGENGSMGREEIDIIIPAMNQLRAEGPFCHRPACPPTRPFLPRNARPTTPFSACITTRR
jgi:4-hydroxythreonine-4-phosphate dehydrogenase